MRFGILRLLSVLARMLLFIFKRPMYSTAVLWSGPVYIMKGPKQKGDISLEIVAYWFCTRSFPLTWKATNLLKIHLF